MNRQVDVRRYPGEESAASFFFQRTRTAEVEPLAGMRHRCLGKGASSRDESGGRYGKTQLVHSTAVMTFIVNQDGVVYQQDLGDQTRDLASQITAYNPDSSWEPAQK